MEKQDESYKGKEEEKKHIEESKVPIVISAGDVQLNVNNLPPSMETEEGKNYDEIFRNALDTARKNANDPLAKFYAIIIKTLEGNYELQLNAINPLAGQKKTYNFEMDTSLKIPKPTLSMLEPYDILFFTLSESIPDKTQFQIQLNYTDNISKQRRLLNERKKRDISPSRVTFLFNLKFEGDSSPRKVSMDPFLQIGIYTYYVLKQDDLTASLAMLKDLFTQFHSAFFVNPIDIDIEPKNSNELHTMLCYFNHLVKTKPSILNSECFCKYVIKLLGLIPIECDWSKVNIPDVFSFIQYLKSVFSEKKYMAMLSNFQKENSSSAQSTKEDAKLMKAGVSKILFLANIEEMQQLQMTHMLIDSCINEGKEGDDPSTSSSGEYLSEFLELIFRNDIALNDTKFKKIRKFAKRNPKIWNKREIMKALLKITPKTQLELYFKDLQHYQITFKIPDEEIATYINYFFYQIDFDLNIIYVVARRYNDLKTNSMFRNAIMKSILPTQFSEILYQQIGSSIIRNFSGEKFRNPISEKKTVLTISQCIGLMYLPRYNELFNDPDLSKRQEKVHLLFCNSEMLSHEVIEYLVPKLPEAELISLISERNQWKSNALEDKKGLLEYFISLTKLIDENSPRELLYKFIENMLEIIKTKATSENHYTKYLIDLPCYFSTITESSCDSIYKERLIKILMNYLKQYIILPKFTSNSSAESSEGHPLVIMINIQRNTEISTIYHKELIKEFMDHFRMKIPNNEQLEKELLMYPSKHAIRFYIYEQALDKPFTEKVDDFLFNVYHGLEGESKQILYRHAESIQNLNLNALDSFEEYIKAMLKHKGIASEGNFSFRKKIEEVSNFFKELVENERLLRDYQTCFCEESTKNELEMFNKLISHKETKKLCELVIPADYNDCITIMKIVVDVCQSRWLKKMIEDERKDAKKSAPLTIKKLNEIIRECYKKFVDTIRDFAFKPGEFKIKLFLEIAKYGNIKEEFEKYYIKVFTDDELNAGNNAIKNRLEITSNYIQLQPKFRKNAENILDMLKWFGLDNSGMTEIFKKYLKDTANENIQELNVQSFIDLNVKFQEDVNIHGEASKGEREERERIVWAIVDALKEGQELVDFSKKLRREECSQMQEAVIDYPKASLDRQTVYNFVDWWMLFDTMRNHSDSYINFYNAIIDCAKNQSDLLEKITMCVMQVGTIIFLYSELFNPEEAKKRKVMELCLHSTFKLKFEKSKGKTWEMSACSAKEESEKAKISEEKKQQSSIMEEKKEEEKKVIKKLEKQIVVDYKELKSLNSRAKLIVTTDIEQGKKEESKEPEDQKKTEKVLKSFMQIIDKLQKVISQLEKLYSLGYPINDADKEKTYLVKNQKLQNMDKTDFMDDIVYEKKLKDWEKLIEELQSSNYFMSCLHGRQAWSLFHHYKIPKNENEKREAQKNKYEDKAIGLLQYMGIKDLPNKEDATFKGIRNVKNEPDDQLAAVSEFVALKGLISTEKYLSKEVKKELMINPKNKHIYYMSSPNIATCLVSLYELTGLPIPLPCQILFCTYHSNEAEIKPFIIRAFLDKVESRMYAMVNPERLSKPVFDEMMRFLRDSQTNSYFLNSFYKIAFIISDEDAQASKEMKFLANEIIPQTKLLKIDTLRLRIKDRVKNNAKIFLSPYAGMGKTSVALKTARSSYDKIYKIIPISGFINLGQIIKNIKQLKSTNASKKLPDLLLFQFDNIPQTDHYALMIFLYQLLILRFLSYKELVLDIPSECYLEFSSNILESIIDPYKSLPQPIIQEFSFDRLFIMAQQERFVTYYLMSEKDKSLENVKIPLLNINSKEDYQKCAKITEDNCRAALKEYNSKLHLISNYISCQIFIKVVNYSMSAFAHSPILLQINDLIKNNGDWKKIFMRINQEIFHSILATSESFTAKMVKDMRTLQDAIRRAINNERGDSRNAMAGAELMVAMLDRPTEIVSWENTSNFILVISPEGFLLPLYKSPIKVPLQVQGCLYVIESMKSFAMSRDRDIVKREITKITNKNFSIPDLTQYKHEELFNLLSRLKVGGTDEKKKEIANNYVLTLDNVLKMAMIFMRGKAKIPIVVMGESGCGKTALVRYLAKVVLDEEFHVLNIHAGIGNDDIVKFMEDKVLKCNIKELKDTQEKDKDNDEKLKPFLLGSNNPQKSTWVFFDEFNTSDSLGLIKEIVCDRKIMGKILPDNLIFVAACNKFTLKKRVEALETEQGLSKELRQERARVTSLEHLVNPIPDTLLEYIFDFGSLNIKDEKKYIENILRSIPEKIKKAFIECLSFSQGYFKSRAGGSSVSLRDIRRYMILYKWFLKDFNQRIADNNKQEISEENLLDNDVKAGFMAVIFCYYLRIQIPERRNEYLEEACKILNENGIYVASVKVIKALLKSEQIFLAKKMTQREDIALNNALLENLHTMFVCLVNRIPLILVGKPGCSKSLAVQLLLDSLIGEEARDPYFKPLGKVQKLYFQGSSSSTSESIIELFKKGKDALAISSGKSKCIPVIVFDEIGLAELSPFNPLKVLHSELEIDNEEGDFNSEKRVAFIGISNWKLDFSKMNRVVYLTRPDPSEEDLIETGKQICANITQDKSIVDDWISKLSIAYSKFKTTISSENQNQRGANIYYGMRDFYSMIKTVANTLKKDGLSNTMKCLRTVRNAIERNFGRLSENIIGSQEIIKCFSEITNKTEIEHMLPSNPMDLIKENLEDPNARYIMAIGEGDIPAYIIEHCLKEKTIPYRHLVGSFFKDDIHKEEYALHCLSDIILLMEQPITLILQNMGHIYSSLYDVFNQSVMKLGQKKFCRIGYGAEYNPRCFINDKFRIIIFLSHTQLAKEDPPFLNRFDKRYLEFEDVMDEDSKEVYQRISSDTQEMLDLLNKNEKLKGKCGNLFMHYSENFLKVLAIEKMKQVKEKEIGQAVRLCMEDLIRLAGLDLIILLEAAKHKNRKEILELYESLHKENFSDIVNSCCGMDRIQNEKYLIYTYSTIESTISSYQNQENKIHIMQKTINSFKESSDLRTDINKFYSEAEYRLLVLHFDYKTDAKHISFVKSMIENEEIAHSGSMEGKTSKNIIFVSHMKRQGGNEQKESQHYFFHNWKLMMIDDIRSRSRLFDSAFFVKSSTSLILEGNFVNLLEPKESICLVLEKCLLSLKYDTSPLIKQEEINLKRTKLINSIAKDQELLEVLRLKLEEVLKNSPEQIDWKIQMYYSTEVMAEAATTTEAIKKYLLEIISQALMDIIFVCENNMATMSYFYNIGNRIYDKQLKEIWIDYFNQFVTKGEVLLKKCMESTKTRYWFNLNFPFIFNEYHIYKSVFNHIIQGKIDKKKSEKDRIAEFVSLIPSKTLLSPEQFNLVGQSEDRNILVSLFYDDLLTIQIYYMKLNVENGAILKELVMYLFPNTSPFVKLYYLFMYESHFSVFLDIVSSLKGYSSKPFVPDFKGFFEENPSNYNDLSFSFLSCLLAYMMRKIFTFVFNKETIFAFKLYLQLLSEIEPKICYFIKLVNEPAWLGDLTNSSYMTFSNINVQQNIANGKLGQIITTSYNLLWSYGEVLANEGEDTARKKFIKALDLLDLATNLKKIETDKDPSFVFKHEPLFKEIKSTCEFIIKNGKEEQAKSNARKLLSDYYHNIIRYGEQLNFLQDYCGFCAAEYQWQFSNKLFDIIYSQGIGDLVDKLTQAGTIISDERELEGKKTLLIEVENYFMKAMKEQNYSLLIMLADLVSKNVSQRTTEWKDMNPEERRAISTVLPLIGKILNESEPAAMFPYIYRTIALGIAHKYFAIFAKMLNFYSADSRAAEETLPVIALFNETIKANSKIGKTMALYTCKHLLNLHNNSLINYAKFMTERLPPECSWKTEFIIKDPSSISSINEFLPVFIPIHNKVLAFEKEFNTYIKTKFFSAADFTKKIALTLGKKGTPEERLIVFMGLFRSLSAHHYEKDTHRMREMWEVWQNGSRVKQDLNEVPSYYLEFMRNLFFNFAIPGKDKLESEKYSLQSISKEFDPEKNKEAVILITMNIISLSLCCIKNPISVLFLDHITTQLKTVFMITSPDIPYIMQLKNEYMIFVEKGDTLYKCGKKDCDYVYPVEGCGDPNTMTECPLCHNIIGGERRNPYGMSGIPILNKPKKLTLSKKDDRNYRAKNVTLNRKCIEEIIKTLEAKAKPEMDISIINFYSSKEYVRNMSPTCFRLLNLLILSSIYYHTTFMVRDYISIDKIKKLLQIAELREVETGIIQSLKIIKNLTLENDTESIYFVFLERLFEYVLKRGDSPQIDKYERNKYEDEIQNKIAGPIIDNLTNVRNEYFKRISSYGSEADGINNMVKSLLSENISEMKKRSEQYQLLPFFRMVKHSPEKRFENIFRNLNLGSKYPITDYYLNNAENIERLQALSPMIEFTNYLQSITQVFTREQARQKLLNDFLNTNQILKVKYKTFEEKYHKFVIPMGKVRSGCREAIPLLLDSGKAVNQFLLDESEEGGGAILALALVTLGQIQNEVLFAVINRRRLQTKQEVKPPMKVKLQHAESKDIITINQPVLDSLLSGVNNPTYGMGSELIYDFYSIEMSLLNIIIKGKELDLEDINYMNYAGEAIASDDNYIMALLSIFPRQDFPEVESKVLIDYFNEKRAKDENTYQEYLKNLYKSLEIILVYIKNAVNPKKSTLLSEFLMSLNIEGDWNENLIKDSFISQKITLERVLNLYELVEERYFEYYRDFISPIFKKKDQERQIKEDLKIFYNTITEKAKYPEVKEIIKTLKRLIMRRFVKEYPSKDNLARTYFGEIYDCWSHTVKEEQIEALINDWPPSIRVADTFVLLDWLEEYSSQGNKLKWR